MISTEGRGTVAKSVITDNFVISGNSQDLFLRKSCMEKFNLKVGDKVVFEGRPFEAVYVKSVISKQEE